MPYITQEKRQEIDESMEVLMGDIFCSFDLSPGDFNYIITQLCLAYEYMSRDGENPTYTAYNQTIGVLECVKQEFYRRAVSVFEDQKKKENGDVF